MKPRKCLKSANLIQNWLLFHVDALHPHLHSGFKTTVPQNSKFKTTVLQNSKQLLQGGEKN